MGLADFGTRRLANKVDFHPTYTNVLTASATLGAKLPIIFETDREAIEGALKTVGLTAPPDTTVARIRNTLDLETLHVSEALMADVRRRPDLEILDGPFEFQFSGAGDLLNPIQ